MPGDAGAESGRGRSLVENEKEAPTPRTLVFDEIDIGIGGRAAEAVGQKLKALGRAQQVLVCDASAADRRLRRSAFFCGEAGRPTAGPRCRSACSTTAPAPTR